jgi:hypothetical protein
MAVTKKPRIDLEMADKFIDNAESIDVITQKHKTGKANQRDNVIIQKRETGKAPKNKRLTYYMTDDMYLQWKKYELKQLTAGKKISFQGVIEKYMTEILEL